MTPAQRRELTDRRHRHLSIVRQCQLMGVSRSSLYYRPKETSRQDLSLMREMDRQYLETPFYGSRRMKASLDRQGMPVSRKRVQRLMRLMGLRAIYRQPRTSQPAAGRWVYPYLLRDLTITRANQVWAADITYLPMARGFLYLVAIMDWHSRYVVAWRLSNTLDTGFCAEALGEALNQGTPEVFNTDQGSQFTSREFTQILQDHSVKISMDGRGRYQDNILVERLWRTVKYEEVYLKAYANGLEARNGLREYFRFYNHRRPHQALGYRTPAEVFHGEPVEEELKERRCPDQPDLVSYGGVQDSHLTICPVFRVHLTLHRTPTPTQQARWEAVRQAREKGLSQRAIARKLGMSRVATRKYAVAESPPTKLLSAKERAKAEALDQSLMVAD